MDIQEINNYNQDNEYYCIACNRNILFSHCYHHNDKVKERYKRYHQHDNYKQHRKLKKYCETCNKYICITNFWKHVKSSKHINNQQILNGTIETL